MVCLHCLDGSRSPPEPAETFILSSAGNAEALRRGRRISDGPEKEDVTLATVVESGWLRCSDFGSGNPSTPRHIRWLNKPRVRCLHSQTALDRGPGCNPDVRSHHRSHCPRPPSLVSLDCVFNVTECFGKRGNSSYFLMDSRPRHISRAGDFPAVKPRL